MLADLPMLAALRAATIARSGIFDAAMVRQIFAQRQSFPRAEIGKTQAREMCSRSQARQHVLSRKPV